MDIGFDRHMQLNSPLHRWDPRAKLLGLGGLVFAFATVDRLGLLLPMGGITAGYYLLARLPLRFLLQRLRYPGFFLLGIVLLLPFVSGETILWDWGPLALRREGCLAVLLISGRFLAIFTLGLILLATTPFLALIKAMRSLGLPKTLADMTLLAYRYLYEIAETLSTMRMALQLRGFGCQRRRFLSLGDLLALVALTGTLLIRTYERSQQVYKAMRLRGYGHEIPGPRRFSGSNRHLWRWNWDLGALLGTLAIATGFLITGI